MSEETKTLYRVKAGYAPVNTTKAGETIELTDREAKPILFKLELVGSEPAPQRPSISDYLDMLSDDELITLRDAVNERLSDVFTDKTLADLLDAKIVEDLATGGFSTVEAANAASDEELLAVNGIGPVAVKTIREALA